MQIFGFQGSNEMVRTGLVEVGDLLVILVDEWNRYIRAVDSIFGYEDVIKQREFKGVGDLLYVQNEGMVDFDVYEFVIIIGVVFVYFEDDEDVYNDDWNESWVLKVKFFLEITDVEWKVSYQWYQFVIIQEFIDVDEVGLVMIFGIILFKIMLFFGLVFSVEMYLWWKDNLESLEVDIYGFVRILYM